MRFQISRTSQFINSETAPHERAVSEQKTYPNGNVCTEWFIEINSLEELIAFAKEVRYELVVTENSIEIYDDWRE